MQYNAAMTSYLVVRPYRNGLASVSIVHGDDVQIDLPFESWALQNGKAIMFANSKLPRLLKQFYVTGAFTSKALYTYSYEELCMIVTAEIGPSDRVRYELMSKPAPATKQAKEFRAWIWAVTFAEAVWTVLYAMGKIAGLIILIVVIPFLIMIIKRHK